MAFSDAAVEALASQRIKMSAIGMGLHYSRIPGQHGSPAVEVNARRFSPASCRVAVRTRWTRAPQCTRLGLKPIGDWHRRTVSTGAIKPGGEPSLPSAQVPPFVMNDLQERVSAVSAVAVERQVDIEAQGGDIDGNNADYQEEQFEEFKAQWVRTPKRIVIFVEPSPFSYVCGYKNRFQNFIRYLQEGGDQVLVVTTHGGAPEEFYGAKVLPAWSFSFPLYKPLPVSFGLSPQILNAVASFEPDIIHATSPGIMCFGALVIAKLLSKPLLFSYHTHVPAYIPRYTFSFLVGPMWVILRLLHWAGDLTLTTSQQLGEELAREGASAGGLVRVWPKGIDPHVFHPRFRSDDTRRRLSGGEPEKPLLVHVGRLGAEKNLDFLRPLLDQLPGARLAFVGDGPARQDLEQLFAGTPTVFTGMLSGDDLSSAYASGDVFLMPSETETLGFVVLEAMSSGLPVVAVRAGGIPDIISKPGVTGFLYEPGDLEAALAHIRALIESPELRSRVGVAARAEVERFDWRAATQAVRREDYTLAAWRSIQKRLSGWRNWLPWWLKKSELQGI